MNNEYKKYGISDDDIIAAALGDFDDFSSSPASERKAGVDKPRESSAHIVASPKKVTKPADEIPNTESNSMFYITDFVKSLFTKEKAGVCIWLIINMLVVSTPIGIIQIVAAQDWSMGLTFIGLGLLFYFTSLAIAISPVGEAILRWQNKCKRIKDDSVRNRLEPIFDQVYQKAKTLCPAISDSVKLFISRDDSPNAFATGRRTVCVTQGLLDLSDEEIEGVLAHEFGHLAHKDTDTILAVSVGNIIVVGVLTVVNLVTNFSIRIYDMFSRSGNGKVMYVIINAIFYAISFAWTKLGTLLCLHAGRKNEFAADNFAVDLGYHRELEDALTTIDSGEFSKPKGLWAALHESHPATADRIMSMNEHILSK